MKRLLFLLLPLLLALLCACSLQGSIEELYSLPQPAEEYLELQRAIDGVLATGAVYSAPVDGTHRQSVQLCDLSGDGQEEAVAFFSATGEKPLKIYIFRQTENGYERSAVLEGDGSSIESIEYLDLDGDGWKEAVVGWGIGGELKMLEVFSLKGFQAASLAATDYNRYLAADLNGDGSWELAAVRRGSAETAGTVTVFDLTADGELTTALGRVSLGMDSISRVLSGNLRDARSALFVEGTCPGGLVTDIFTYDGEELTNITLEESGLSETTIRSSTAACQDLSGDGVVLIPIPRSLPAQGETIYRVLDWYGYNSRGRRTIVCTTYHNYSDSWYLTLPDSWKGDLTLRREDGDSGERAVIFSLWNGDGEAVTDFLVIYALSGENRRELAAREGRVILRSGGETIYAAELRLDKSNWDEAPDIAWLRQNFHLIYS